MRMVHVSTPLERSPFSLNVPIGMAVLTFAVTVTATLIFLLAALPAQAGGTISSGEDDIVLTGPSWARVDKRYASPKAAREQLRSHTQQTRGSRLLQLDPALYGEWTTLAYPTTVRAIHVTLLRTGKVLLMAGSGNNAANFVAGSFTAELWDPVAHTLVQVPPPWDMFCAGHVVGPDGNVLVMGGTTDYQSIGGVWKGSNKTYRFNIETGTWEQRASMSKGRWYPTAILDPTGKKVLVYSGKDENGLNARDHEIYDIASDTWTYLPARTFPLYPGMLWTARDQIFFSGAATGTTRDNAGLLSPYSNVFKRVLGGIDMTTRNAAATVFAGAVQNQLAWLVGGGFPATSSTVLTDLTQTQPVSVAGPALPTAKAYVSAVNLPDLTVLETGGGTARNAPVYEASIFQPSNRSIQPVAPPTIGRTYHSSAILLPDASVATFGGNPGQTRFELRIEIYKPNYFFKGPRPTISAAPTEVTYGATYPIVASATDATLDKAVLIRPSSTTHSTDANQRSVLLAFELSPDGGIFTMPPAPNRAPPGWYMLFLIDSLGRPSTATWVHLSSPS